MVCRAARWNMPVQHTRWCQQTLSISSPRVPPHYIKHIAQNGPSSTCRCHTFASLRMMNATFFFLFRSFVILASGACAFAWPTSATGTMLSWRARPKTMMIIIIINSFFIHPGDASTAHIVHFIVRFEWCCRRAYTTIDQFASIAHHRLNFDRETLKPAGRPFFKPPTKKIIIHYLLLFTQNNYPLLCLRRITLLFSKPFYDTPSGKWTVKRSRRANRQPGTSQNAY